MRHGLLCVSTTHRSVPAGQQCLSHARTLPPGGLPKLRGHLISSQKFLNLHPGLHLNMEFQPLKDWDLSFEDFEHPNLSPHVISGNCVSNVLVLEALCFQINSLHFYIDTTGRIRILPFPDSWGLHRIPKCVILTGYQEYLFIRHPFAPPFGPSSLHT